MKWSIILAPAVALLSISLGCTRSSTVDVESKAAPTTASAQVTSTVAGAPANSALTRSLSADAKTKVDTSKYPMHDPKSWDAYVGEIKAQFPAKASLAEASQPVAAAFNVPVTSLSNVQYAYSESLPVAALYVLCRPPSAGGEVLVQIAANASPADATQELARMTRYANTFSDGPGITNVTRVEVGTILNGTVAVLVTYTAGRIAYEFHIGTRSISVDIAPGNDQAAAENYTAELASNFSAVNT